MQWGAYFPPYIYWHFYPSCFFLPLFILPYKCSLDKLSLHLLNNPLQSDICSSDFPEITLLKTTDDLLTAKSDDIFTPHLAPSLGNLTMLIVSSFSKPSLLLVSMTNCSSISPLISLTLLDFPHWILFFFPLNTGLSEVLLMSLSCCKPVGCHYLSQFQLLISLWRWPTPSVPISPLIVRLLHLTPSLEYKLSMTRLYLLFFLIFLFLML